MSQYTSACDTMCDTWYGAAGGYREYSYADWAWDSVMDIIGCFSTPDELWEGIFADMEGAYFSEGHGEKDLGGGMLAAVDHVADGMGAFDASYFRIVRDGKIVMELSAESDNETSATSGISVLCDNLFARIAS